MEIIDFQQEKQKREQESSRKRRIAEIVLLFKQNKINYLQAKTMLSTEGVHQFPEIFDLLFAGDKK